ncbi:MAG: 3-dehydroquinate synthase [Alphaproteobacteria bacterium]|nr:3-dehydroquinate synthase [Alphaproteobacteria bacterium]
MSVKDGGPVSVAVDLGPRSYEIAIGSGLLGELGVRTKALARGVRVFVVTDENVARAYLAPAMECLAQAGLNPESFVLGSGEKTKSFAQVEKLSSDLLAAGIERSSLIVALGGGVIGDLAGFAASIVLRGVDYIQVPTTLLAQVDSSVGGKTAIDTGAGKNLIGSFYQPRLVLADTSALDTLPRRELLAGYAEVVKYAVLGDADFFAWLEENGPAALDGDGSERTQMIAKCCTMKADIVARDETETGARVLLNLGHTFGHALEAVAGYGGELLHGEGVAIGLCLAYRLSVELGHGQASELDRVAGHLEAVGLATSPPKAWADGSPAEWPVDRLMEAMHHDKKVSDGVPVFVLPRKLGDAFVARDVPIETVEALLRGATAD